MWWKLLFNSFKRDPRKKVVVISAVALATCLATFLLNWSLNLGDKIQRDLRAYGANIVVLPLGDSLPPVAENIDLSQLTSDRYLKSDEIGRLQGIFWKNQILAYAPMLPERVLMDGQEVTLVGTEFGVGATSANSESPPGASLAKIAPYLTVSGTWPASKNELVIGTTLAERFNWKVGDELLVSSETQKRTFLITGIVESGGEEDQQAFASMRNVQELTGHSNEFKRLLVSAVVNSENDLYFKYQRNPKSLTPQEYERFSCTPYITSVANDIAKVISGSEARVVRQISKTEEKISKKVNWLMILVTLAALIASSLTMTSTTTAMVFERRKELALMKAIGSQNQFIVSYLFSEIILLGVLGSVIGFVLGSALSVELSQALFESTFQAKMIVLPLICVVGTLIILCGSIWPIRQAVALEPAQALKDL